VNVVNGNTATGTTATADPGSVPTEPAPDRRRGPDIPSLSSSYTGRFAPSPTGDLHLGSLLAAIGSYVDARHHEGRWLVRIEDLDTPRVIPGSAARMLRTLDNFGLHWDGSVVYQSERIDLYRAAIDKLKSAGLTFECSCARSDRPKSADICGYPGTCRGGPTRSGPTATRFRLDHPVVLFDDRIQGECPVTGASRCDFVIRRKDGLFSYQLAVVVDDAAQHVTDVVRGADLLPSTSWQIALQRALHQPVVRYAHVPTVMDQTRGKLAKSRQSVAVDPDRAASTIAFVLRLLNHPPPAELESAGPTSLLEWAVGSWNPQRLRGVSTVTACHIEATKKLGSSSDMD
jgi:glutamyl-Q tRNA(Asp) synthetase